MDNRTPSRVTGRYKKAVKIAGAVAVVVILIFGCKTPKKPHQRIGSFFGNPLGMSFPDPNNLGKHHFNSSWMEKNGMLYTRRGGFIDLAHLRESADRTLYLKEIAFENIVNGQTDFSFRLIEPSSYTVTIHYPHYWAPLPEQKKKEIADEVSICIGQYLAHTTTVWHEIVTWFGFASVPFFPETPSSFSWEDNYSDLLGVWLAGEAMRGKTHTFEQALTLLIDQELQRLEVQSPDVARRAEETIKTKWFSRKRLTITMNKRNFDTGDNNGFITPWLVPGICPDSEPVPYPKPCLQTANKCGFSIDVTMNPTEKQSRTILAIAHPNRNAKYLRPSEDFSTILEYIEKQAHKQYGSQVDVPQL